MTRLLSGKTVKRLVQHRANEVLIEFDDGTRLFADAESPIELSITDSDQSE